MKDIIPVDLNPPQRKAVTHTQGPLLILAGAGSGKTRVLACRTAYLIHSVKAAPYRILALTFTNKAANELKARVIAMAGDLGKYTVAGTFHSIFARLMRQEGKRIGVDPNFSVVDTDDRRRLIRAILRELNVSSKTVSPGQIEGMISRAKNNLLSPEDFASLVEYPIQRIAALVYPIYEDRLKRMSGLDFDDLLTRPIKAFEEYPDFLKKLQERFQYVMVDEYQDTNHVQYLLIREIARRHGNLCVVGDDDQAIYGWRGANIENILEFERDWSDVQVIRLEQNYRSTKPILDAAWSVISHNSQRHPKKLWTEKIEGHKIDVVAAYDEEEEARRFIMIIQDEHQLHNRPYNQFAILYRTNAQSLPFERMLRTAAIPYYVIGGLRFYERKEVKDVLAYLRLIVNPADDVSLLRIINYPPRRIGTDLVNELQSRAIREKITMFRSVERAIDDPELSAPRRKTLSQFVKMMTHFRQSASELNFHELASAIVAKIELRERLTVEEKSDLSRAESKLANLDNLLHDITRYSFFSQLAADDTVHPDDPVREGSDQYGPDRAAETTLEQITSFLEEVTLITEMDDADDNEEKVERVNLLTLHSAKGLEFPVVMIGGLEDGLLPLIHGDRAEDEREIEEERRLFYVGATRAMDRLILGYATGRAKWGSWQYNGPSRFLREIPSEYIAGMEPATTARRRKAHPPLTPPPRAGKIYTPTPPPLVGGELKGGASSPIAQPHASERSGSTGTSLTADTLRKGLLVRHRKFGLGIVIGFRRMGIKSQVRVDFDDVGEKLLVLQYANLEIER